MDLKNITLSDISQIQKEKNCMSPLIRISRIGKFILTESKLEVSGAGGREKGELLLNDYRISVWDNVKFLEMVVQHCP